jgi:Amt family ammonium transporter
MTPGLAFFYAGLVRSKNVLATMMHSFIVMGLISVIWVIVGYSLAFGSDWFGGLVGNPSDFFGMKDVGQEPTEGSTIPHVLFMVFQMTFAIITPALITGAFAERAKFAPFLVFMALWSLLVYAPVAHWVWGDSGWLQDLWGGGALDFAGGTVVHVNAGAAALVAAILYGRRLGYGEEPMEPHNIPFVLLGAAILWFGWFGFNAGSALASDGLAANAFATTFVATAAAMVTWALMSWTFVGKPSAVGVAAGAVAGLVAITPAAGFVDLMPALAIGVGAGLFCYGAVQLRIRMRLDDSLDVVGVHGVGGAWGAFATGIFAVATVGGGAGLIDDNAGQIARQLTGIGATFAYSFIVTFAILKVLDMTVGLRVEEDAERIGVDQSEHGERGYVFEV